MTEPARSEGAHGTGQQLVAIPKVPTHIAGLDAILDGGLPTGRTTLLRGAAGSGKSILGWEFLYRGALAGDPGILVAFEEQAAIVRRNALALGWDFAPLEQAGKISLFEARVDPETIFLGTFNLKGLLAIISGQAAAMGAKRLVVDALDVLLRLFHDPVQERNELHTFHDYLLHQEMTTIVTMKDSEGNDFRYEFLDFMVDCVIKVSHRVSSQVATRVLQVVKYRGSGFGRNEYPYVITAGGLTTQPLSSVILEHHALGDAASSGHAQLDTVLGGGYRHGSAVLIAGTTGTGKTTLACTFVSAACQRGERVLYLNFEESVVSLISCMLSPGIDLRPALQAGVLRFLTTMPEERDTEEHLFLALAALETFQPAHVVVDTVSACRRMGTPQAAFEYLMRLLNVCKSRGITCIYLNELTGLQNLNEITGIGLSSMLDTIVFLRFIDTGSELTRRLLVVKSRGMQHSHQYHQFYITGQGMIIPDV